MTSYAQAVVAHLIPSGRTQWLACKRHLDDLAKERTKEFPYYFCEKDANRIIEFAERLILAEGDEPRPLKLHDFQAFCFGCLNGWKKLNGKRRFRKSYIQLARQQGKSLFNGVMVMFFGNFAKYNYAQVYAAATKQDQAKIVVNEAIKFINADPWLRGDGKGRTGEFWIREHASEIKCLRTRGTIKALGADTKTLDGFRPFFGSIDEYHAHKTNQIYKLLQSGTKKLVECLISVITTAGDNLNGPCHKLYEYCKQVLEGVVKDEAQFAFITELDEDDDPYDESNWVKSNPLWDETVLESIRVQAVEAKNMGGEDEKEFLTKVLNIWVGFLKNAFIKLKHWKKCASERDLAKFLQKHPEAKCYVGLDLSQGGDLTSLGLVFVYLENGEKKYYIHTHSFIPSNRVAEHIKTDNAPYDMWIRNGLLTVTETLGGIKTDYKYIIEYLKKQIKKFKLDIQMICYDPYNASAFLSDLEELGFPSVEIKQSALVLSEPTEDFALEVEAGNVEYHTKSELLTWSAINAKVSRNAYGNKKIDKASQTERIDPISAIINAWKMAMLLVEGFNFQKSIDAYLEMMDDWDDETKGGES